MPNTTLWAHSHYIVSVRSQFYLRQTKLFLKIRSIGIGHNETLESQLILDCKNNCRGSQEKIYRHFYAYAFRVSSLNAYSRDEAVDIMNDSFLKFFEALDSFNEKKPVKPWFRKIIVNTAIDRHRKKRNEFLCFEPTAMDNAQVSADVFENLNIEDILNALNQLSRTHRMVFTLYEMEGYNHSQVAEKLNIAESSSRTFLTRAKQKLRTILAQSNVSDP